MGDLATDRVYDDRTGDETVAVGSGVGVAVVSVANGRVGRFRLAAACTVRDLAVATGGDAGGRLAVATPDALLFGGPEGTLAGTGFGPATAVGVDGSVVIAAAPDGTVGRGRLVADGLEGWTTLGTVQGEVRAVDGSMLATDEGIVRVADGTLVPAGLADVRDLTVRPSPFAATGSGLFRLANGWERDRDGAWDVVAGACEAAVAAGPEVLGYEEGTWRPRDPPVDPVDCAFGAATYAVDRNGRLAVESGGEWRVRSLGLAETGVCAVLDPAA